MNYGTYGQTKRGGESYAWGRKKKKLWSKKAYGIVLKT